MYCYRCGTKLANLPPVTCPGCGQGHWKNPKPGAGALVVESGRLLLVRRAHDPWMGDWDIPGGFSEADEHPITTAERELFEETGLRVSLTGFLGAWLDRYGSPSDPLLRETTLNIYYHATLLGPDVPDPDPAEVAEIGWFAPSEIPQAIAFPGHIPAVLAAWRDAMSRGETMSTLPDRPH